jgi:hypothetical protein
MGQEGLVLRVEGSLSGVLTLCRLLPGVDLRHFLLFRVEPPIWRRLNGSKELLVPPEEGDKKIPGKRAGDEFAID